MKIDFKCAVNTYNLPVAGGDRVIQNLQKQIDKLEERIRDIMEDESLSLEAKQQQKEQLELQLTAIRQQILARQRELQREKATPKPDPSAEDVSGEQPAAVSELSARAIISADSAMSQINAKDSVRADLKNEARKLASEISLDAARGVDVSGKVSALSGLEGRIDSLTAEMAGDMSSVHEAFEAAREQKPEEDKAVRERKPEEDKDAQDEEKAEAHIDGYI